MDVLAPYVPADARYDGAMPYNRLGTSGLKMSALSLGFWHNFGATANMEQMRKLCRTAFDLGITVFDCANNYGPHYGAAEENLGRILKADFAPYRDELLITSKAGYDMWLGPYGDHGSRKYLIASCDQSLKRLGLDYVDIFYHHRMDPETPLEETCGALAQIVASGKALYAGVSNYSPEYTARAAEILTELRCPFVINQVRYSILDRHIEPQGLKDVAAQAGIGLTAFSPLAQGLLTNKYLHGVPADSRIARDPRFLRNAALTPERLQQIEELNKIAEARGQSLAQMAVAWILRDGAVASVLVGASKPEQLRDSAQAVENTSFSEEELAAIDAIAPADAPYKLY